jgi:RNA polymerase sigma-70 factor (ECF subfamily)
VVKNSVCWENNRKIDRRKWVPAAVKDGVNVFEASAAPAAPEDLKVFRAMCAEAMPQVYGWVYNRCGDATLAEDLTAEAMLAGAARYRDGHGQAVTVPWLTMVAGHRLIDHWRRADREQRRLRVVWNTRDEGDVPCAGGSSPTRVAAALRQLGPAYQGVLTLRYLDDLPVTEVARTLARSVHATESLLSRAKAAFRIAYSRCSDD